MRHPAAAWTLRRFDGGARRVSRFGTGTTMRVLRTVNGSAAARIGITRRHAGRPISAETGPQPGHALIAVPPVWSGGPAPASDRGSRRPLAAFLAHLLASRDQAPQTRARRRAEPGEATAAYAVASASVARTGGAISRSV